MTIKSPIWWIGGKGKFINKLLRLVPPHKQYVECFGGGASLLFAKTPVQLEIYNDINTNLTNLFQTLQNDTTFKQFKRHACLTLYSKTEHMYSRNDNAYDFWKKCRMGFGGLAHHQWGSITNFCSGQMISSAKNFLKAILALDSIHHRLQSVKIHNQDWKKVFEEYDEYNTFFYLDPPYIRQASSKLVQYEHEFTEEMHIQLVNTIISAKAKIMLSGYDNEIYKQLEKSGWTKLIFKTGSFIAGRTKFVRNISVKEKHRLQGKQGIILEKSPRYECIWINY